VAVLRADCGAVGDRTGCIAVCLLGNLSEGQGGHLLRVHFPSLGEGLMSESLTGMCEACLLEILLRCRTGDCLLEIHLELRHDELLVLGRCGGISTTVVWEVTLHVGRLLLRRVVHARRVHRIRLVMSGREGA